MEQINALSRWIGEMGWVIDILPDLQLSKKD